MRTNRLRLWLLAMGVAILTGVLAVAAASIAKAQDGPRDLTVTTPPVDIHTGTCADFAPEPAYELGDLRINTWIGDDWPFIEADLDGDGIAEAGRDTNGNGVLDQGEVIVQWTPPAALTVESEVDASIDALFDAPHVVAVHESAADYTTVIACGEVVGIEEDGQIYISLRPVNRSDYDGYAVFERDTGNVPIIGENTTGVTVRVFHGLSTSRDQPVAPTGAAGAEEDVTTRSFAAAIHQGTCDQLGSVAFPLRELGTDDGNPGVAVPGATGVEEVVLVGPPDAVPAWQSAAEVPAQFDALLASPHVVVVSTGPADGGHVVACGVLGGRLVGETLLFGLREVGNSGYTGAVLLAPGGAKTNASVLLAATGAAAPSGAPVPSPATPTS